MNNCASTTMASFSELASEVTGTSRVSKRNHGMRLAAPIANECEGQAVVDACVARSATKIMVGGRAVFAEYPSQINYMRGVESASKSMKRKVNALNVAYIDVAHEIAQDGIVRVLHGYSEDDLSVTFEPSKRKRNKAELATLACTSARELVATGVVAPNRYALTVKTQADLGILLENDGARRRITAGRCIKLSFVVGYFIIFNYILIFIY